MIDQRHREHVASLAECESRIQAFANKVSELEAALTLANTKAEMLETKNKKLSKTVDELRQSIAEDRLEKQQLTTENDKQRRNSKMIKSELDEAKLRIVDAEQRILDAQKEIEFKNGELEQKDIDAAQLIVEAEQGQQAEQRRAIEQDQEINRLNREKEQLSAENQKLVKRIAIHGQMIEELQNGQRVHFAEREAEAKGYSEKIEALLDDIVALEKAIDEKEKAYEVLSESKMALAQHTQHAMQQMRNTICLLTHRKEAAPSSVGSSAESETLWSLSSSLDEMMPFSKTWLPSFRS